MPPSVAIKFGWFDILPCDTNTPPEETLMTFFERIKNVFKI